MINPSHHKTIFFNLIIVIFGLTLNSCQAGNPEVTLLSSLKGLQLYNPTKIVNEKTFKDIITISGYCPDIADSILVSFNNGTTYQAITANTNQGTQNLCSTQKYFSIQINPSLFPADLFIPTDSQYKIILVQAVTKLGKTTAMPYFIQIKKSKIELLTAASKSSGTTVDNINYTFKTRLIATDHQSLPAANGVFKGKITIK